MSVLKQIEVNDVEVMKIESQTVKYKNHDFWAKGKIQASKSASEAKLYQYFDIMIFTRLYVRPMYLVGIRLL